MKQRIKSITYLTLLICFFTSGSVFAKNDRTETTSKKTTEETTVETNIGDSITAFTDTMQNVYKTTSKMKISETNDVNLSLYSEEGVGGFLKMSF